MVVSFKLITNVKVETKHAVSKLAHMLTPTHTYSEAMRLIHVLTFPVELQGAQQADRLEHLSDVHLQTALQLDEEPADLRVDLPVLWPETEHKVEHREVTGCS